MSARVLLADDDASLRFVLSQALSKEGYQVRATSNVSTLAKWVKEGEGDIVLSDVYMGEECVFDALPDMRIARPNLPIIVMSAQSTVSTALSAASAGAYDYLPKPFDLDELMQALRRGLSGGPDPKTRAQTSKAEKEEKLPLIGRSAAMQDVYRVMARVAGSDLTVLIEGESGAGKERVARAIHDHSRRAKGPFVAVSLAGIGARQIETDLFGGGGKLEQARGGTLYLEDIDEMPTESQLRFAAMLQSSEAEEADVRLIVAAQRNLAALARQGAFRQDLFYRLNVVTIHLPPLRDRLDDVGDLARAFLLRAKREGLPEKSIDAAAVERLKTHAFPGNVRELENMLRRAAALSPAPVITDRDIAQQLGAAAAARAQSDSPDESFEAAVSRRLTEEFGIAGADLPVAGLYDRLLAELERPLILQTLKATGGNQVKAAAVLGINRNTLRKKIQSLGLPTGKGD
ncbi:MAG: sigma 54-interacting transcriptional regulator [Hyphomonadaceae bacterium]|nr:sigma 54-interacting transcriptional regulator [Hyphomonadaceae bacterium]